MKTRSAKHKGYRLEKYVVSAFKMLDESAHRISGSGSGDEGNDVRVPALRLRIECKNQKKLDAVAWWEKTRTRAESKGDEPVLLMRNPRRPEFEDILAVVSFEFLLELLQGRM